MHEITKKLYSKYTSDSKEIDNYSELTDMMACILDFVLRTVEDKHHETHKEIMEMLKNLLHL
jgi:hypothetical protein